MTTDDAVATAHDDAAPDVVDAPVVEVTDYSDAIHVLRSAAYVQITPESGHGAEWTRHLAHGTVQHLDDDDHFERRRILASLFRRRSLAHYERDVLIPSLDRTTADLGTGRDGSTVAVDLLRVTREAFLSVLARLVGLTGLDTAESRAVFLDDFAVYELGFRAKFVEEPRSAVLAAMEAKNRILERHFQPAWDERVAALSIGADDAAERHDDLITLLIENLDHYRRWGDDAAWREALLFMVASVGSTANAVCHAVADLFGWVSEHPEDRDALVDPSFLSDAFRDSVRLHQTNVLLRTVRQPDQCPSGRSMPSGSVAVVDREAINRGLEAETGGADVRRFDPRRQMPAGRHDFGLAFGEGPHACIGRTMVLGEHGTARERQDGRLDGLAVATLAHLFSRGLAPDPEQPPVFVEGMARETLVRFPVIVDLVGADR